jgi:hypothetical protein
MGALEHPHEVELEGQKLQCDCFLSATGRSGAVDGLNLEVPVAVQSLKKTMQWHMVYSYSLFIDYMNVLNILI